MRGVWVWDCISIVMGVDVMYALDVMTPLKPVSATHKLAHSVCVGVAHPYS